MIQQITIKSIKDLNENKPILEKIFKVLSEKKEGINLLEKESIHDFNIIPLIVDIEIFKLKKIETCLIGFYLPSENIVFSLMIRQTDENDYKRAIQLLLKMLIANISWDSKSGTNVCLIGHNLLSFDLPVLCAFLNDYNTPLKNVCDVLISGEPAAFSYKKEIYKYFTDKIIIIDTLYAQRETEAKKNSLFSFKMRIFLNEALLPPKEMSFSWENVDLKQVLEYNFNDLFYTYKLLTYDQSCKEFYLSRIRAIKLFLQEDQNSEYLLTKMLVTTGGALNSDFIGRCSGYNPPNNYPFYGKNIVYLRDYAFKKVHVNNFFIKSIENAPLNAKGYSERLSQLGKAYDVCKQHFKPGLGGLHNQKR